MAIDVAGLKVNEPLIPNVTLARDLSYDRWLEPDQPHWLEKAHGTLYDIDRNDRVVPTKHSANHFYYSLYTSDSIRIGGEVDLTHKWVDRIAGERIRPVYVTPVASVIPKSDVLIATGGPQSITVEVEALTDSLVGQVSMVPPLSLIHI